MASSPKTYFRNYVVIVIALFVGGILLIRTQGTLEDLEMYEGILDEIKLTSYKDTDQAVTPVVSFTINGLESKFGITENFGDLTVFTRSLKPGDKIKFYYSHYTEFSKGDITHMVAQLEKDGVILLDIQDGNKENRIAGFVLVAASIIGSVLTVRYYRNNVKAKS